MTELIKKLEELGIIEALQKGYDFTTKYLNSDAETCRETAKEVLKHSMGQTDELSKLFVDVATEYTINAILDELDLKANPDAKLEEDDIAALALLLALMKRLSK